MATKEIVVTSVTGASGTYAVKDGAVAVFKRTSEDLSTWTQSVIRADFAWANDMLIRDVDGDGEVDIMVFDNFLAGAFTEFPRRGLLPQKPGRRCYRPGQLAEDYDLRRRYDLGRSRPDNEYLWAKAIASFHQAYFLDLDGDGREDFVTSSISMYIWQHKVHESAVRQAVPVDRVVQGRNRPGCVSFRFLRPVCYW